MPKIDVIASFCRKLCSSIRCNNIGTLVTVPSIRLLEVQIALLRALLVRGATIAAASGRSKVRESQRGNT